MKADASDIRNQPAYGPAEAARYLRLPAATLRTWLVGRAYPKGDAQATFHPLIKPANAQPLQVSFYNLIEAHVLRAMRRSGPPSGPSQSTLMWPSGGPSYVVPEFLRPPSRIALTPVSPSRLSPTTTICRATRLSKRCFTPGRRESGLLHRSRPRETVSAHPC